MYFTNILSNRSLRNIFKEEYTENKSEIFLVFWGEIWKTWMHSKPIVKHWGRDLEIMMKSHIIARRKSKTNSLGEFLKLEDKNNCLPKLNLKGKEKQYLWKHKNGQQLFITIIYLSLQILHNRAKKTEADQLC